MDRAGRVLAMVDDEPALRSVLRAAAGLSTPGSRPADALGAWAAPSVDADVALAALAAVVADAADGAASADVPRRSQVPKVAPIPQVVATLDALGDPRWASDRFSALARQTRRLGLDPSWVVASAVVGSGHEVNAVVAAWRADEAVASHPVMVVPSPELGRAQRLGVLGRALLEGAAVLTDDLRGARRMLEVFTAIDANAAARSVAPPLVGRAS